MQKVIFGLVNIKLNMVDDLHSGGAMFIVVLMGRGSEGGNYLWRSSM